MGSICVRLPVCYMYKGAAVFSTWPNFPTSHFDRVYILSPLLTRELLTLLTKSASPQITLRGTDGLLLLRLHRARHHSAITLL